MPKYKLVEMPDVHNTGKRKVYPKMVANHTMSQADFIEHMKIYTSRTPKCPYAIKGLMLFRDCLQDKVRPIAFLG